MIIQQISKNQNQIKSNIYYVRIHKKEMSEVIPIEDGPYIRYKINILQCKI